MITGWCKITLGNCILDAVRILYDIIDTRIGYCAVNVNITWTSEIFACQKLNTPTGWREPLFSKTWCGSLAEPHGEGALRREKISPSDEESQCKGDFSTSCWSELSTRLPASPFLQATGPRPLRVTKLYITPRVRPSRGSPGDAAVRNAEMCFGEVQFMTIYWVTLMT